MKEARVSRTLICHLPEQRVIVVKKSPIVSGLKAEDVLLGFHVFSEVFVNIKVVWPNVQEQ